ncbi:MAG: DUF1302 family protein [Candidatus Accumulibacter sp.]|nr:DUF1302 family protein [Accumulibacter sp.]
MNHISHIHRPRAATAARAPIHPHFTVRHALAIGLCALAWMSARPGWAAAIATPSDDVQIVWNNTLRYNWATRMQGRDPRIANHAVFDQGDALFDRYDTIANRLDWLTEFDLSYRRNYGLRITAAAWYDAAYGNHGRSNPNAQGANVVPNSYTDDKFTSYVKRYYAGPSGELLDAFVYGVFDIGDTVWNVKVGRHALVWGESLFGNTHAISFSQVPSDGMKGATNPGASAKETALPVAQTSLIAQINPELSLLTQVGFEWKPTRIPEAGTYFGVDTVNKGPNLNRLSSIDGKAGDLGLGMKWSPEWLDGTLGFYARRFDDKNGWLAQDAGGGQTRAVYARDISLFGVTLVKRIGSVLAGAELSYRLDDPLNSAGSAGPAGGYEGARGNTWHGVLNGIVSFSPSAVYDSAFLAAELAWNRLDRVTRNRELYWAKGYNPACDSEATIKGCADKQFFSLGLSFTPTWTQVYPGVDISMPLFYSRGIAGNAPSNGGGVEGFTVYKVGLSAKVYSNHQFDLTYTGYDQKIQDLPGTTFGSRLLGGPLRDKGWLSFTYQTTF